MASHYEALDVHPKSSLEEIRRAYHRAARQHHPDKRSAPAAADDDAAVVETRVETGTEATIVADGAIASDHRFLRIQEAYETLRDAEKRAQYDNKIAQEEVLRKRDGEDVRIADEVSVADMTKEVLHDDENGDEVIYSHQCRCGDVYEIAEDELLDGVDVAPCNGCSLNIRVVMQTP
uniref:Diphthamide biosynthesis protein 3 n=1 Tax=Globisporangium ultimum (strain ATCC 200006 / CBS 805.95 / DAOM BR144) TaxID=431595 RepID=K3WAS9_GLOUD